MDIYQAIWDADMRGNGIRPISITEKGDISEGYVVVDTEACNPEHRILKEVHIPDKKRCSYQLIEKLFDNYKLNQTSEEKNTMSESKEVEEFLQMDLNQHHRDQIEMTCAHHHDQTSASPYVITVGYHLDAFDYEKKRFVKIIKKRCAFLVGISPEGLLALGTVRAMPEEVLPDNFVINGVPYKLELFMNPDVKSIRTFYPNYVPS